MQETWLRTNRRILFLGMILPAVLILGGLILALAFRFNAAPWVPYVAYAATAIGLFLLLLILLQLTRPRLAYVPGELLVYLRAGSPFRVPVEIVECFFFGAGVGQVPAGQNIPVRNLVLRLSEKAADFHHRDVKPALGRWDDGYIVIHGAWCEPLNLEVVKRLNVRLAEAQIAHKATAQANVG
jgi:hypothetical protein